MADSKVDAPGSGTGETSPIPDSKFDSTARYAGGGPIPTDRTPSEGDELQELAGLQFLSPPTREGAVGRIGEYDALAVVGRGGMGIVLKAYDDSLHRTVAIKVLAPQLAASVKFRRRFLQEARAAAAVSHPNVVTIHAVGEHAGLPYLVMEYIPGRTLRERIQRGPPLEMTDLLRIASQIASGLEAAHAQGLIHRDIKPLNILLENGIERVKIADFGLARAALENSDVTSLGAIVGTPAYMSPEQVSGGKVDGRSDLFSLGSVLFAMVTGHSPFQGTDTMVIIRQVLDFDPPPVGKSFPHVLPEFSDLIVKLLEKDPARRCQSAREVAAYLTELLASFQASSVGQRAPSQKSPSEKKSATRRLANWKSGLALVAVVAAITIPFWGQRLWHAMPAGIPAAREPLPKSDPPASALPAPVRAAPVLTVAGTAPADFRELGVALRNAQPGTTIRILDSGTYQGPYRIAEPKRLEGLVIEAASGQNPRLVRTAAERGAVVDIDGVANVTLQGLQIDAGEGQHGIRIQGAVPGLHLDRIRCVELTGVAQSPLPVVKCLPGTTGTAEHPLLVSNCEIVCSRGQGLWIEGTRESPVSWLIAEGNRFSSDADGSLCVLWGSMRDIQIRRNVFLMGGVGINLNFEPPHVAQRIGLVNNAFLRNPFWIGLVRSAPEQAEAVTIANNLILETPAIQKGPTPLETFASHPQWSFTGNWWEAAPGAEADAGLGGRIATIHPEIAVLSRDPMHDDFLRLPAGSEWARSGPKGD